MDSTETLSWSYVCGDVKTDTQESSVPAIGEDSESGDPSPASSNRVNYLPSTICVCSNDVVWAELLAQNLGMRGLDTVKCSLSDLKNQVASLTGGSWVVVDGGWPMLELQNSANDLNPVLKRSNVTTVMIVDELVGPHTVDAFEPDAVIKRTPDMRILVRKLLSLFQSRSRDRVALA